MKIGAYLGLLSSLLLAACGENVKPVVDHIKVRPAQLLQIDLLQTKAHIFPATVAASKQASLSFRVPGQISKYHVLSGQTVKTGELLAELIPIEYMAIASAKNANFELAQIKHKRSAALIGDFVISQEQFDKTLTNLKVSENELDQAQSNVSYTKIYAPYDGVIAATYLNDHEYTQALQPVMSIHSENNIDVILNIPERLIGAIKRARNAETKVTPEAMFPVKKGRSYPLAFKEIKTTADAETGSFSVTLTMPQPTDVKLYPGMAATVSLTLQLNKESLIQSIPSGAIMREGQQTFVWLVQGVDKNLIKTAVELTDNNQLLSGLKDGDVIVAAGAIELTAEQRVKEWVKEKGL